MNNYYVILFFCLQSSFSMELSKHGSECDFEQDGLGSYYVVELLELDNAYDTRHIPQAPLNVYYNSPACLTTSENNDRQILEAVNRTEKRIIEASSYSANPLLFQQEIETACKNYACYLAIIQNVRIKGKIEELFKNYLAYLSKNSESVRYDIEYLTYDTAYRDVESNISFYEATLYSQENSCYDVLCIQTIISGNYCVLAQSYLNSDLRRAFRTFYTGFNKHRDYFVWGSNACPYLDQKSKETTMSSLKNNIISYLKTNKPLINKIFSSNILSKTERVGMKKNLFADYVVLHNSFINDPLWCAEIRNIIEDTGFVI